MLTSEPESPPLLTYLLTYLLTSEPETPPPLRCEGEKGTANLRICNREEGDGIGGEETGGGGRDELVALLELVDL